MKVFKIINQVNILFIFIKITHCRKEVKLPYS